MEEKIILIAGAGGIGKAAGLILATSNHVNCKIIIGDRFQHAADASVKYINDGSEKNVASALLIPESGSSEALQNALSQADIILDCLPGSQAPRFAEFAKSHRCHYANLTEYVNETNIVTEIAKSADTGFILQTGLAPGYINVLSMHVFNKFTKKHNIDKVDSLDMKVGALSKHARSPYFYAFTWSPIGVATEYVKDAIVVENYETLKVPSLSRTESILIDGIQYEDDFTSGGAADLPIALAGRVKNLNYKTLRFPGHYDWAKKIINETPADSDKIGHINTTMINTIPSVEDDMVLIFVSVKGKDASGKLRAMEKSIRIYPSRIGNQMMRAIQTTTAAPLCEAVRMLLSGELKGPVFQSQIDPLSFLNGPFVKAIYGPIE